MDRTAFEALVDRLGAAWSAGDASAAAACFSDDVDYADPMSYRFSSRAQLETFFEPPPHGHRVEWHRVLFDEAARTGVVEYTYVGHHRYHGAAIIVIDDQGHISAWREWQHRDDERDWADYMRGPTR